MSETIETVNFEPGKKHYMSWPVIALIDFVTIISFENIFYPFQNQGLSVVVSWIFLLFAYVIPYALMSSQMGLTFTDQAGGLASWVRHSSNDTLATGLHGCIGFKLFLIWSMFLIQLLCPFHGLFWATIL